MNNVIFLNTLELYELTQSSSQLVLIDTRSKSAYDHGHLPGAVHMPEVFTYLADSSPEGVKHLEKTFAELFGKAGISKEKQVIFYDDALNIELGRACRGAFILHYFGHPCVYVLSGSFQIWKNAGLPIEQKEVKNNGLPFIFSETQKNIILDRRALIQAIDNPKVIILDVRDSNEWIGQASSPNAEGATLLAGRILSAHWIEWRRFLKPAHYGYVFKSQEEVLAECHSAGILPDDSIYLYCYRGSRAALVYFLLLNVGFKNVSVYFASWQEWAREQEQLIEKGFPALSRRLV